MGTLLPFMELFDIFIETFPAFSLNLKHIFQSFPKLRLTSSAKERRIFYLVQAIRQKISIQHKAFKKSSKKY